MGSLLLLVKPYGSMHRMRDIYIGYEKVIQQKSERKRTNTRKKETSYKSGPGTGSGTILEQSSPGRTHLSA